MPPHARPTLAPRRRGARVVLGALCVLLAACARGGADGATEITFAGSAVGAEGALLARQIARFERATPGVRVRIQRTPDDATQRHQLFVQWLNAHTGDPDVLQLDVVWTAELAAAGWIAPLERFHPDTGDFFPAALRAARWRDTLYAVPWYVDVGMLYWRTDLLDHAPRTMEELAADGRLAGRPGEPPFGIVWQGARYEGLVTVFLEYLGGFGGRIMTDDGRVVVDSPEGIRALAFMRDEIGTIAPREVLTWHEEETRFAFQNGRALLMRNWPYAAALMSDAATSRVAGRFAIAPMPAAPGGAPTAALGGAELAINLRSDHPAAAYRLVEFLTAPAQMLERARAAGYYPARRPLFYDPRLRAALPVPAAQARAVIDHAVPRPVTPIYSQLSELLQIQLQRALAGQASPDDALHTAAAQMNALIARTRVRELMTARREH